MLLPDQLPSGMPTSEESKSFALFAESAFFGTERNLLYKRLALANRSSVTTEYSYSSGQADLLASLQGIILLVGRYD